VPKILLEIPILAGLELIFKAPELVKTKEDIEIKYKITNKEKYDSFVKNIQEDNRLNLNSPAFSYLNNYTCSCYLNSDCTDINEEWFEIIANPALEGSFACRLYSVEDYMKCLRNFNRFLGM
jgi:hypothetical protein